MAAGMTYGGEGLSTKGTKDTKRGERRERLAAMTGALDSSATLGMAGGGRGGRGFSPPLGSRFRGNDGYGSGNDERRRGGRDLRASVCGALAGADGEAAGGEVALGLLDGVVAVVEDAGGEDGVRPARLERVVEVLEVAGAAAGDDGDADAV